MTLSPENSDKLQGLSNELKNAERTRAQLADLATRRILDTSDEEAIRQAIRYPEYKEEASIAYTYPSFVTHADSFQWVPGEYEPAYGWAIKPTFNVSLEANPGAKIHDTDLYGLVKSISGKRFTEQTRRNIEATAPTLLQIVGLENGLEIINPYDLRSWMKEAGVIDKKDDNILPIKVLMKPHPKQKPAEESDYPERTDLEDIVDKLFIGSEDLTIGAGILNHADEGSPRGLIKEFGGDKEKIDDERLLNLIEIRDQWPGAQIVETESLIGDKSKYVALILPELGTTTNETAKEWAIAENPQVGNALFIVNPYQLADGASWRDVLLESTKKEASGRGAMRLIHTQGDGWKDRLLDFITSPR